MMKTAFKKLVSLFTVLSVCFAIIPLFAFDGFAADGVSMRLEKLKKDFPTGYYYNHKVKTNKDTIKNLLEERNEAYSASVTRYPCTDHGDTAQTGTYDCNYFDGGYQCHGFASMLFYEIFGVRQSTLEKRKKSFSSIKPGDLVRLKKDSHSAIVVSVNGSTFTVAESNVGSLTEAESCKIRWGKSYKLSDITYYVRANNYDKISADTDWKKIEGKENPGSSFYAAIYNGNKVMTVYNGSAVLKAYTGSASQIWKFTRQKNGSYKVENCKNGRFLEVDGAVKSGKAKIKTSKTFSGKKSQLWAFYKSGEKYYLSADCGVSVLTAVADGSMRVDKKTAGSSRLFTVKKKSPPEASTLKAKSANASVSLSWTKGKNTSSFDVRIYNSSAKLYKEIKGQKGTSLKLSLPAGTYSAEIISRNAFSQTVGNRVYFTVGKKGVLGKTAKVTDSQTVSSITLSWTAVPDADCYAIFNKTSKGWKTVAVTEKTKHTFSKLSAGKKYTLGIKACKKDKNGKLIPSEEYVSFTTATKLVATDKISVSQTESSVTLKWNEVKKADGYAVYKKTSSGWEKLGTTADKKYTVNGLSAGASYTFGVSAYMKTTLGTVYGEIKSVSVATKPAAPTLTLSNVKNLKATIRWNKVSGADGYQVFYKTDNGEGYTHLANYKATDGGIEIKNLKNGVNYTLAVRAYKKSGGKNIYGAYAFVSFKAKYA